jgi:hypothetical protein
MKTCTRCKEQKDISEFPPNKHRKDGLFGWCRPCVRINANERSAKNRDKKRAYDKEYRAKNWNKVQQAKKKCYHARQEHYVNNAVQWNKTHAEHRKVYMREYVKNRIMVDEIFRIKVLMGRMVYRAFQSSSVKPATMQIIGLNAKDLQCHLYQSFEKLYGRPVSDQDVVHIDHIIPLSSGKTFEDFVKLSHYSNLQLLLAIHNQQKFNKTEWVLPCL